MHATVARHGRLDILVNNAGISGALADRLSTEHFDRLMTVNARGTFLGVKTAIPEMKKAGAGSIVNVSSISGLIGQPYVHMGYNAAKAAFVSHHQIHGRAIWNGRHSLQLRASGDLCRR